MAKAGWMRRAISTPLGIAATYATLSLLWVVGGDQLIWLMFGQAKAGFAAELGTVKGVVFVLITAAFWCVVLAIRDQRISDSSQKLAATEDRYRVLFDLHPVPVFLFDATTRRVFSANPAAVEMYGYSPQEFERMTLTELRAPEERESLAQMIIDGARSAVQRETVHLRKDGSRVNVRVTHRPVRLGPVEARLAIAIDITSEKRAEARMRQSLDDLEVKVAARTAQLRQANDELAAFCQAISVDLTTPLQNIRQWARAITAVTSNADDAVSESARRIAGAALRSETLLADLLAISSSAGPLPSEPLSLAVMLYETLGKLERLTPGITSRFAIEEPMPWIIGHRATLQRAMGIILRDTAERADATALPPPPGLQGADTAPKLTVIPASCDRTGSLATLRIDGRKSPEGTRVATPADLALAVRALRQMGGNLAVDLADDHFTYIVTMVAHELMSSGGQTAQNEPLAVTRPAT